MMKRYAVFGRGYYAPACYVFAIALDEAWEKARTVIGDRFQIKLIIECA